MRPIGCGGNAKYLTICAMAIGGALRRASPLAASTVARLNQWSQGTDHLPCCRP